MEPVKILIVDDEAPQMRAICDTLMDHGYVTTGFTSGVDALAEVHPGRFDLFLTDLMMPKMDGITFLQEVMRKDPALVGIIMTGAGTIATAVEAMKVGAFDYLLKPFSLSSILPILSRALTVRRLRQDNADLQQRVRLRTEELEVANRELETFSYSVSHDLRAPLRAVRGFSHILIEDHGRMLAPEARNLLDRINTNADRMEQIIEDLLRFAQFSKQPLSRVEVDVRALVAGIIEEQRLENPGRTVDVHVGDLPPCSADPSLLKQVYVNLISNAFKYSKPKAESRIDIDCLRDDGKCVYYVRDNGVGFNPQHAGKLFGVFVRLHGAEQFSGTGVGLSIVQRIIQRHGGRIWAESQIDQGATFYFTIPG